ncbi:MAG: glycosyltransferase [Clostridia bacterium]|nr:glycosyltransferase [Clostridia bacterium]
MKKILLTCTDLMAVQFFTDHIKFWHENGYCVDLACSPVGGRIDDLVEFFGGIKNGSIKTVALNRSPLKMSNLKGFLQLIKIAQKEHYDNVVTNEPVMGLLTRLAFANKKGTKITYIAHGFHFYKGGSKLNNLIYKAIEGFAAHFTDSLVTINKEDFEAAKRFRLKKNGKIHHIPGIGVSTSKFYKSSKEDCLEIRKELGLSGDDFAVAVIGELNNNKNQEVIIRAIASLKDECPGLKAVFMGKGEKAEYLENLCNELNVEDRIQFLGYRRDVNRVLSVCNLGASASIREGLGVNLIEEMASGLPIVASENRGHRDIVTEDSGILVQATSVDGFAEAILSFYKSPEKCEVVSKSNFELCKQFDVETVKLLLLSIIEG